VSIGSTTQIGCKLGIKGTEVSLSQTAALSRISNVENMLAGSIADDQAVTFKSTMTANPYTETRAEVSYRTSTIGTEYTALIDIDGAERIIKGKWIAQLNGDVTMDITSKKLPQPTDSATAVSATSSRNTDESSAAQTSAPTAAVSDDVKQYTGDAITSVAAAAVVLLLVSLVLHQLL
jgi:hypothetical protein